MSSLSNINAYDYLIKQINIYFGLFILILGIIGNLFNIIIFKRNQRFQRSTCVYCLTIASIFNIGQLITGILFNILIGDFHIDLIDLSSLCKIRKIIVQWFGLLSLNSLCFAIINQFFLIKYQYSISLKLTTNFLIITCLIWSIHDIFFIFSYDLFHDKCQIIHINFETYITYFYFPIPTEFLLLLIIIIFAFRIFINIKTNIKRSNHNRQLTIMILIQVIFIFIVTIPSITGYIYSVRISFKNMKYNAYYQLIYTIINYIYYTIYAVSFNNEFDK